MTRLDEIRAERKKLLEEALALLKTEYPIGTRVWWGPEGSGAVGVVTKHEHYATGSIRVLVQIELGHGRSTWIDEARILGRELPK